MTSQENNLTGKDNHIRKITSRKRTSEVDNLTGIQIKVNGLTSQYVLSFAQLSPSFFGIIFILLHFISVKDYVKS